MAQTPQNHEITKLLKIDLPIIQGGMVYCSGGKLAAAVSETGALGVIGAGSMSVDLLKSQIEKALSLTRRPIAVNLPLLYSQVEAQIKVCLDAGINIFFTSAGSPKKYTSMLKGNGSRVIHVTSTPMLAKKCEDAGVDAIVAEGFEAGGHNGREELTTMTLIPQVREAVKIPIIAAGGIGDGRGIAAAFALGSDAVQIGSRFAATVESSAHDHFKKKIVEMKPGDTNLCLKQLVPVRLYKNEFCEEVEKAEARNASTSELQQLLGKGRARKGMLEGDMVDGELEIGQISGLIQDIPTVADLVSRLLDEYRASVSGLPSHLH